MTMQEVIEKIKAENARSKEKYGPWKNITDRRQASAINSEYMEWYSAYIKGDVDGEHGELREAVQLANLCIRRIMYLTGERDA